MYKALNNSTYRQGPQTNTHTHTQNKMDPVGVYSVEPGRYTFPPRAVTPTPNHHGETQTHDPKSTAHVPGCLAATTTRSHRKGPQTTTETKPPRPQTKPITTKTADALSTTNPPSLEVEAIYFSSHSPPDWTVVSWGVSRRLGGPPPEEALS